jgi:predicted house-cleaning noncanonical NTP pyrophosphatase (MazG superfamily)
MIITVKIAIDPYNTELRVEHDAIEKAGAEQANLVTKLEEGIRQFIADEYGEKVAKDLVNVFVTIQ